MSLIVGTVEFYSRRIMLLLLYECLSILICHFTWSA